MTSTCAWCHQPMPPGRRADAVTCSTRCRQARHRFTRGVGPAPTVRTSDPLHFAYADPPYPGLSRRYYVDHPDYAGEVDHAALIASLSAAHDGWALSTSAAALPAVLALCPPGIRVAAWHRGERPTRSRGPLNGWEPVIFAGGRDRYASPVDARRVDSLVLRPGVRTTDPDRVVGAKPAGFARWVFDLLGAQPGDHFTDVFPGSGGVARAWDTYCAAAVSPAVATRHAEIESARQAEVPG